jgi:hypothetical protein
MQNLNLFHDASASMAKEGLALSPTLLKEAGSKGTSYAEMFSQATLPLPRLPWLIQALTDLEEESEFKAPLVVALLPILGALATNIRFDYYDGEEHSLSFMTCIQGETSSGKSFVKRYVDLLTIPFLEEEDRLGPQTTSISALCQKMQITCGKHLFTFYPELAVLVQHSKRGSWANLNQFFCLAFDNSIYSQAMISRQGTWSGTIQLLLNMLATGTPRACKSFFNGNAIEGGMLNRWIITELPDRFGEPMRRFRPITEDLKYEVGSAALWLMEQGGQLAFPPLLEAIQTWVNQKGDLAKATASKAVDEFRKRSAVNGFRAGMLCYLLEQYNSTLTEDEIVNFGLWVAEYTFCNHMSLFGSRVDKAASEKQRINGHKVPYMLPMLPKQFTREDVSLLQTQLGNSNADPKQNISYWKQIGCIKEVVKGLRYEKVV